jgi:ribonuclease J
MFEIFCLGGYSEVGKNMTAIKYNNQIIILDMGIHLEEYIKLNDNNENEFLSKNELIKCGAIPDDGPINKFKDQVIAIIPSHGHLDHIGAIPYMAETYDCPIICTPYTSAIVKAILKDKDMVLKNKIIPIKLNNKIKLSDEITAEFINMTHSIPHTALVIIHTPDGSIAYANDFKLDNHPTLGSKPNYKRIKNLGKSGNIKALIVDSLYADHHQKTPSESIAQHLLKDVLIDTDSKDKAVIVTTFSSHIARLNSIVECGKRMKRKVVFLGRSLAKYIYAAEDVGLVKFSKKAEVCNYKKHVAKKLKQISQNPGKFLIVCTGHQGEPTAILSRIADGHFEFDLMPEDHIVFSCTTIPSEINEQNRQILEEKLMHKKVRIFKDIHVSGHACREDHRDFIKMLNPQHVIPSHGPKEKTEHLANLAKEMGYSEDNIHLMEDKKIIKIK